MAPRKRKTDNQGLPRYLYNHSKRPGWRLLNPMTGKETYLPHREYTEAQARRLAEKIAEQVSTGRVDSVAVLVPRYLDYLKLGNNSPSTLAVKKTILNAYVKKIGKFPVSAVSRGALQDHWETIGPHGWQKHRVLWKGFLDWCGSKGYVQRNEAEFTLPPPKLGRITKRHTPEGVALIYAKADPWLRRAMDLAIYSLQDRGTLCAAKRESVRDVPTGFAWDSTRLKTDSPLTIMVPKGTKLYAALREAKGAQIAGNYLVRRDNKRRVVSEARTEWSQVLPDQLSKAFAKAREAAKPYPNYSTSEQPGFHQLRAYGSWLYKQAGFSTEHVQALMAHESVEMTEAYQDGHGDKVKRELVEAGL